MKTLSIPSLTLGVCLLALSSGVAFATDLHDPAHNNTNLSTPLKGQTGTGSNPLGPGTAVSSCGGTGTVVSNFKPNNGALGADSATVAVGSPFNMVNGGGKNYAGAGKGNLSNPKVNSQYDNACAQSQLH